MSHASAVCAAVIQTLLSGVVPESHPLKLAPPEATGGPASARGSTSHHAGAAPAMRRLVIVDEAVDALWGLEIRRYFAEHRVDARFLTVPTREENKTFDLVFEIAEEIEHFKLNRRKEPVIAIGGGVCLDVCGLAANLYRRNTPVIKVRLQPGAPHLSLLYDVPACVQYLQLKGREVVAGGCLCCCTCAVAGCRHQ